MDYAFGELELNRLEVHVQPENRRSRAIPERLLQAYNDSGTRHIIAISGFNISLLAGVLTAR